MPHLNGMVSGLLDSLQSQVSLHLACSKCSHRENESTYLLKEVDHHCMMEILLAKCQGARGSQWRKVDRRPSFPRPAFYDICQYYVAGLGCTRHRNCCTFAWSQEEVIVWTFERKYNLERHVLKCLLQQAQSGVPPSAQHKPADLSNPEEILSEFGGYFQEICETCFYSSPQRISPRGSTHTCTNHWGFTLVHVIADGKKKEQYTEIRPCPAGRRLFSYCSSVSAGRPCPNSCIFAHSDVELAIWKAEQGQGLERTNLLRPVVEATASPLDSEPQYQFYCRVCLVTCDSQQSFENHCSSVEHTQLIATDTLTEWTYRAPPYNPKTFALCSRPDICEYGQDCARAHSVQELEEWIQRAKIAERKKKVAKQDGLLAYQDLLIAEYQTSHNEVLIMPLIHVALLKRVPGANFYLGVPGKGPLLTYASGNSFKTVRASPPAVEVKVHLKSHIFGVYEQWLVFDFGSRPVLVQKLYARVGQKEAPWRVDPATESMSCFVHSRRWHTGNCIVVPSVHRTDKDVELLAKYKAPSLSMDFQRGARGKPITRINYREEMHNFLFREEEAQQLLISKLNLHAKVSFVKSVEILPLGLKFALPEQLYAQVPTPYSLTMDSDEGYLLQRSVRTAFLAQDPPANNRVYEVSIEKEALTERNVCLLLPQRSCTELGLQPDTSAKMEVQFQTDQLQFCQWHQAVDSLWDVKLVFPDVTNCSIPHGTLQVSWGNTKQKQALRFITGQVTGFCRTPPLLIYGPFGTGKTFTLAKTTLEIIKKPQTRVLICTHTNSAADIYIRDYFHNYAISSHPEAIPLRVKSIYRSVRSTDPITLRYCCCSPSGNEFCLPTREQIDRHRIVLTTCMISRDLGVPCGYFTHILIDEAAQMLECEALVPLTLASLTTLIILAGDHMQKTPRLYSLHKDEQSADYTLLNRLFQHYKKEQHEVATKSRIIFNENYRSTAGIIEFVSKHFYVGREDTIGAKGNVPPHPEFYPLMFCHVSGSAEKDRSMSWYNISEIEQIIEKVQEMDQKWPVEWEQKKLSSICVYFNNARVLNTIITRAQSQVIVVGDAVALCSHGQCSKIWKSFIKKCIEKKSITPETLTLEEIKQVTSDLASWNRGSPKSEEEGSDTDSWDSDTESLKVDDPILQELLDESKQLMVLVTEEGLLKVKSDVSVPERRRQEYSNYSLQTMQQHLQRQPQQYKRCKFIQERFDQASAFTLDEASSMTIQIKGRVNCGMAFTGDQVLVEILTREATLEGNPHGKVVGILKRVEQDLTFVCRVDEFDLRVMIPIDQTVTKIYVPPLRDDADSIPIRRPDQAGNIKLKSRKKITPENRKTCLFVVQIVKWKEGYYYPLGIVTEVLPLASSLDDGLRILDLEYRLSNGYPALVNSQVAELISNHPTLMRAERKDCRAYFTFTVDPSGAKDLDDAISVRDMGDKYEIGIHIADLASVIPKDCPLDTEAKNRGLSYYAPEKPIHMFPSQLSQNLCSLLPHKERLVISLFVIMDKATDQMETISFAMSIICSDRQMTYEEAEGIIKNYYKIEAPSPNFDTLEDYVAMAYHFSRVHRKSRLHEDCHYDQLDEEIPLGQRCSHQMIEELMILFNSSVADLLTKQTPTRNLTPLRCQMEPNPQQISQMREKYRDVIPLSTHLSHHLGTPTDDALVRTMHPFVLLASSWDHLKSAANDRDFPKMLDLITTDDIHPKLAPINLEFRKLLNRSYFLRSNSCPQAKLGHYSLHVDSYTWATSPIRRYVDVVVQRHIISLISKKPIQYSETEIEFLCHDFNQKNGRANMYQRRIQSLELATQLKCQVQKKFAFIANVEGIAKNFKLLFPLNKETFPDSPSISYRALQLVSQPNFIEERNSMKLTWRRRIYSLVTKKEDEAKWSEIGGNIFRFDGDVWHEILAAVKNEDYEKLIHLLEKSYTLESKPVGSVGRSKCLHYKELSVELKVGDVLNFQLTTDVQRGFLVPFVQLWTVAPGFEVCLEHTERPIDCFSKYTSQAPKNIYKNASDYRKVWLPLCDIEATLGALAENSSIVLQDVPILWKRQRTSQGQFCGTINLTKKFLKECGIEVDFGTCYMCIRLSGLRGPGIQDKGEDLSQSFQQLCLSKEATKTQDFMIDPDTYTWVAHGCTDKFEENEKPDQRGDVMPERKSSTGKTVVGAHIVYWFHQLNQENNENTTRTGEMPPQSTMGDTTFKSHILYCGPSHKSVDVVAEMLMRISHDSLRPLRVYGHTIESMDFPYPGSNLQFSRKAQRNTKSKPEIRSITLHYRIREKSNPYAEQIVRFDERVKRGEEITEDEVDRYKRLLSKARGYELQCHNVVLCTCSASSSKFLAEKLRVRQLLIDECAMCTEPETLIPLHKDICQFPSINFYNNKLMTSPQIIRGSSTLYHRSKFECTPIIFGHIEGRERSLVVSTEEGNENSKANLEEVEQVVSKPEVQVRIAKQLTLDRTTRPEEIAILTGYNAQVIEIKKQLALDGIRDVSVCTIMKSQGSEWKYVIVSTVRSCNREEIDERPTRSWENNRIGFIADANQINVCLTRAQEGLCIIGKR
ncbi:Peroxisomal proliferator-activated receptor A-interacting complex protein, partial [Ophiophagus hannah]